MSKVLGNAAMPLTVEIMFADGVWQKLHDQLSAADCSFCACTTFAAHRAFTSRAVGIQPEMHVLPWPANPCL